MNDIKPLSTIFQGGAMLAAGAPRPTMTTSTSPIDSGDFRAMLRGLLGASGAPNGASDGAVSANDPRDARRAAEQLVAITFVQPLLAQARQTSNAAPPFAPGAIEKQFGPILDAELSDRIVRASRWPLVDRVAHDMRGQPSEPRIGPEIKEGVSHGDRH